VRRILCWFAAATFLLAGICESAATTRLLFVGNSLTYVGNLPAVLDALADANGRTVASDMLVSAGATLSERVADGSARRAIAADRYDYVILQERGGDLIGAQGDASVRRSNAAHDALARFSRSHGVKPILLGTYQTMPEPSRALVAAESAAAQRLTMTYVGVSQRLRTAMTSAPDAEWFAADHVHPGPDLTLLEALLLYRQLFGELPRAAPLAIDVPMYGVHSGFSTPTLVPAGSAPATEPAHRYSRERVERILAIATSP
jgi:hypothetical protein